MPSPPHASEPQNEMELRLQHLIDAGLNSGEPVAFASAAEFVGSLHARSAARAAQAALTHPAL
jgi:hypothetical protein